MQSVSSNLRKTLTTLAVVGLMGTFTSTGLAQPAGGGPARAGGMLDDQQQQVLREALQKNGDQLRALGEKLRGAQKELVEATVAEKYDEKVVREKAEAVAKIQVEMIVLRSKALAAVAPTLKPEQKENLINSRMSTFLLTSGFETMGGDRNGFRGRGDRGGDARPRDRNRQ